MSLIQSTPKMKEMLQRYFQDFFPAPGAKPVKIAWCTSVGPAEILLAMGYKVYYPENHGALLGATRFANECIPVANSIGYSPDICSYLTSDIGSFLKNETPLTKAYNIPHIPRPDVLVYSTNQCREVQDWFNFYAKQFNVPAFGIFAPYKVDGMEKNQLDYVESQFRELIAKLESLQKTKINYDELARITELSGKSARLWDQFLKTAKHHPSPISFFDSCIQMAPAVVLRGTEDAVNYYELLNKEMLALTASNKSAVKTEKIRLYWDGMPLWGKLRFFADTFAQNHACVVASTYCSSWVFDGFSGALPLRSLAEGYTKIFINRSENIKEKILVELAQEYDIKGMIFHDAKTCPYNSNSRFGMSERLIKDHHIPCLVINGDLNDLRCFSEDQTLTSIETFIEQLSSN